MHKHIILPNKPALVEEISSNRSKFSIEPLNPGYGVTIANSLRRIMLSSLLGTSVTYYKINGVDHEFTTIPGVLEDVLDITLNIKELRFETTLNEPIRVTIKSTGAKKITGNDIKLPAELVLINKDAHIMTVTEADKTIEMELIVEKGFGLRRGTEQHSKTEIGLMAVDSIFSPINRVSYEVEDVRVGDKTNYNKIILDITTDGSISPLSAIEQSATILIAQLECLAGDARSSMTFGNGKVEDEYKEPTVELSSIDLNILKVTQRTIKALESAGILNVAQLAQLSKDQLSAIKGISAKAVDNLLDQLKQFGVEIE